MVPPEALQTMQKGCIGFCCKGYEKVVSHQVRAILIKYFGAPQIAHSGQSSTGCIGVCGVWQGEGHSSTTGVFT